MNKILDLIRETLRGKSLARILLNQALHERVGVLRGDVLDVAGGGSSYERYLDLSGARLVTTNIDPVRRPTKIHDFNEPLPFAGDSFDAVLTVNSLYIVRDPATLAREVFRTLRPGGSWHVISPFVFGVTPEPDDFVRFTDQGLRRLLVEAGFEVVGPWPIGGRAVSAWGLIEPPRLPALLKLPMRLLALALDATVLRQLNRRNPAPLGYYVEGHKS